MTDRELMLQALTELIRCRVFVTTREKIKHPEGTELYDNLIEALRTRLAQPEQVEYTGNGTAGREADVRPSGFFFQMPKQEPVAWTVRGLITDFSRDFSAYQTKTYTVPLYTSSHSATNSADSAETFCKSEPVGRFAQFSDGIWKEVTNGSAGQPLYTAPPQREFIGLTDEEITEAYDYWSDPSRSAYGGAHSADGEYVSMEATWRYIEAKLKEKNT